MIPQLGIIEGYFGRAWSWSDRAEVVNRLVSAGYGYFHYAPKIDSKLRRNWQVLHDASETGSIQSFARHCQGLKVRFGVGLSPYGAHLGFDAATRSALKAKLMHLNSMGIEDLAILFDDMRGDVTDLAQRQAEIVAFAVENSHASRFFMCPTYYSNDPVLDRVFGARPPEYLESLGKLLDPSISVYWTGEEVCSREYRAGHLADVVSRLGRKLSLWDNYPVNDGPRMAGHLHLRAFTGRPSDAGQYIDHHAINPASQPILGCIPALTLPQSYDEGERYCYGSAFFDASVAVCGTDLASMLQADLMSLQDSGLDRLGERRDTLRQNYAAVGHPAAREIVDWLDGGYAVTGEMLQTQ